MKLILALGIIFIILKNAWSSSCNIPHGLHVYELGIVYTLTCLDLRIGVHFDKKSRTFSKFQSFYRATCNEKGDLILFNPQTDGMIFCADKTCLIPDSLKLLKNFSQYFNGSVIAPIDLSEIYYCVEFKWYSLFNTDLPKDLININKVYLHNEQQPSYKPWVEIQKSDNDSKPIKTPKIFLNNVQHHQNFSSIKNLKLLHKNDKNIDLCVIAIIVTVISSFFFIITIILILTSRFIQKNHIKHSFIQPNSTFMDSKTFIDQEKMENNNENNKSKANNNNVNALYSNNINNEISCIIPVTQSGKAEYRIPSKFSKNPKLGK